MASLLFGESFQLRFVWGWSKTPKVEPLSDNAEIEHGVTRNVIKPGAYRMKNTDFKSAILDCLNEDPKKGNIAFLTRLFDKNEFDAMKQKIELLLKE